MAKILSLNVSLSKGMEKKPVDEVTLRLIMVL